MSKIWEVKETEVEMMRQMSVYVILEIKDMNKYEDVWNGDQRFYRYEN